MKSLPVVVISVLAGLCAIGCILLIIVILQTSDKNDTFVDSLKKLINRPTATTVTPANDAIRLPDRFKEADEVITPPDTRSPDSAQQPPLPPPAYRTKYTCGEMVPASALGSLIAGNNLFCQKSPWSRQWANPKGKGLRLKQTGLLFADSIITDTLTNFMWQRYATGQPLSFNRLDSVITSMNTANWQGYSNWRVPTIEELLTLLSPQRNHYGHHLPGNWNCKADDIWSCNGAVDSLSTRWMWVVRMSLGRCNYGRPDIARAVLAVREM